MEKHDYTMDKYNPNIWREKVGRNLTKKEYEIIKDSRCEYRMNMKINEVQMRLNKIGFKISDLTDLEGNCMYESIGFNVHEDIEVIKKKVSSSMKKWRNEPAIKGNDLVLEELCMIYNEIEFVKVNGKREKYTFDLMVLDLLQDNGWQRMPTEILLHIISKIYNKKIIIFRNEGGSINVIDNIFIEPESTATDDLENDIKDDTEDKVIDTVFKGMIEGCNKDIHQFSHIKKDNGRDEKIVDEYLCEESFDLSKKNLTVDIISDSIKLVLIDETHYVPAKNIINRDKKICVISRYCGEDEEFTKLVEKMENEIERKKCVPKTFGGMGVSDSDSDSESCSSGLMMIDDSDDEKEV
jgi:hypothetical protein